MPKIIIKEDDNTLSNRQTISGSISGGGGVNGSISGGGSSSGSVTPGGGTSDHNRLTNRGLADQHPMGAISGLNAELAKKLDAKTAMPLITEATKGKAKGLYFDAMKELAKKSYWYLTSEIDPVTKLGTKASIISGPYDLGAGGGGSGGGGGLTTVTVKQHNWPTTVVVGANANITVIWSSTMGEDKTPTGNGTLYLSVNNKQVEVKANQAQGEISFNVTKYLIAGNNTIQIKVLDAYGTTGITVGTINAVTLELKSTFDATVSYTGVINYTYVPYGDVDKTVYFKIDGQPHGTQLVTSTGESQTYRISSLTHGAHSLEVYFTASVAGEIVTSNTLYYDLIYYIPGNETPIIASDFNELEQEQYINFNIPYRVFIYNKNLFDVSLIVNGTPIQNLTVNSAVQYWEYKNDVPGNYELTIACGSTSRTFNVHINKSTLNIQPVTMDSALALSAQGRNNSEDLAVRSSWRDELNDINCELTSFNWSSNGWVKDIAGNTVLRVSGDARVKIPYKPFAEDFKTRGKTIELEIATSAVRNYSSTIISCLDKSRVDTYTADTSLVNSDIRAKAFDVVLDQKKIAEAGLTLGTHVFNYTANGWAYENTIINLEDYGISLNERVQEPDGTGENYLYIGDNILITYARTARGFYVTPQVAAFRSQQSELSTQYKEDEHVRLSFVIERSTANRIIWMYINGIASGAVQYPVDDNFRQLDPDFIEIGSNDAVVDIYNIRIYDNSLTSKQVVNNWIADTQDAATRAERYYRNDNYNDRNELVIAKLPSDLPYMIWDIDPLPEYKGDKRLGNVQYVDPLNTERNFNSENATYNVQGTSSAVYPVKNIRIKYKANKDFPNATFSWYDDNGETLTEFPITVPDGIGDNYFTYKVDYASSEGANNVELVRLYNEAAKEYGIYTPPQRQDARVRVGIDGFPIVAFHQDSNGNLKFCTKANFNNDKANEDVYGFATGDESWEITNNSADEAKFKKPITKDNFGNGFEIRFPDEDGYSNMSKLGPMSTWLASTYRAEATGNAFEAPISFTYNETTLAEDGSFSTTEVTKTFEADTAEYRLAKFKAELKDWFNVDSTLFYYVFTLLYLMIDSRAKNAFPTYFASRQEGDGGDRWFWLPYDMDTAIGIDNKGKLSFDYYLEDFDKIDDADVYNGQDSVIWTNVRDAFPGEIAEMYAKLRNQRLISYENTEKMFAEHHAKWSENIFNEDSHNKYIVPLQKGDNYLEMLQGSKAQQRKWWLYNRFKYMDSKYNAGDAKADFIQFRAYVDENTEKPNITITPYADIYATVSYANGANGTKSKRAKRNEPIVIENPFSFSEKETDQETYIYSASQLKSIGDISPFRPDTVKVGNAVKLQDLKIGDASPDYTNPYLTELTLGSNTLLKSLDVRNCINLTQAVDVSKCTNIEEIYFSGTKISGITLPDGGNLKTLHLPETLTKLTLKNLPLLTDLNLAGTANIESLWLENIPSSSINAKAMVAQMKKNAAIRLIGIDESYADWQTLKAFYANLDEMQGMDATGELLPKAQVTGKIHVPHIPYADFVQLSAAYPEVTILADAIVCTIDFINEGKIYQTVLVNKGEVLTSPGIPEKAMTQSHYYKFEYWQLADGTKLEADYVVESDLTFTAVYSERIRQYTATFEPDSDLITVLPSSQTVDFGTTITEPLVTDVPDGVTLIGWYKPDGTLWIFEGENASVLESDLVLTAKWQDANLPTVLANRLTFNTFEFVAKDNLGITGYAVMRDTSAIPTDWEATEILSELRGTYTVTAPGTYTLWVRDRNGNTASTTIVAQSITYGIGEGLSSLTLTEGEATVVNFALTGTKVTLTAEIDSHYENLVLQVNGAPASSGMVFTVSSFMLIEASCDRKTYTINFVTGKESVQIEEPAQYIKYLNLVAAPQSRYYAGYIIDSWYLDSTYTVLWDFNTNLVQGDTTLYAKWVEYTMPTRITIEVTDETRRNLTDEEATSGVTKEDLPIRSIDVRFTQKAANLVRVNFGDSEEFFTSDETEHVAILQHVYAEPGTYVVEIYGKPFNNAIGYLLGDGYSNQVINPVESIIDIDFAWDVSKTADYAFKGASITELKLTEYMSEVSTGAFAICHNLKKLEFPRSIKILQTQAFESCFGIETIRIPATIEAVGNSVFYQAQSLRELIIEPGKLEHIGGAFCSNSKKLTKLDIPATVKSIGSSAFATCTGLTKVILRNPNLEMSPQIFSATTHLITAGPINWEAVGESSEYNIEYAWTTKIPDNAFGQKVSTFNYSNLERVDLPEGLEEIGANAFAGTSLASIKIPATVKIIGANAFQDTALQTVSLPASLTYLGGNAFMDNAFLTSVYMNFTGSTFKVSAPELCWFANCMNETLHLYVPASLATDPLKLETAYGTYWNVRKVNETTGETFTIDYSGIDPEI